MSNLSEVEEKFLRFGVIYKILQRYSIINGIFNCVEYIQFPSPLLEKSILLGWIEFFE